MKTTSLLCIVLLTARPLFAEAPAKEDVSGRLQSTNVPAVDFRQVPSGDAIEYLRGEYRRFNGAGLPITLPADRAALQKPIDLHLTQILLAAALHYVVQTAGLEMALTPSRVVIRTAGPKAAACAPKATAQSTPQLAPSLPVDTPFVSCELPVSSSSWRDKLTGTAGNGAPGDFSAQSLLESAGVKFPPGATAVYVTTTQKLVVRNTRENIDRIQSLFGADEH